MKGFFSHDFFLNDFKFWRYLINVWTLLFFFVIIYDFIGDNCLSSLLNIVSAIYIGVLAIYVSNKEFERWYDKHQSQHPGEVFVIFWSVLVFSIIVLDFVFGKSYQLPAAVISSYIAVLTILAVTKKSKEIYLRRHPKNK